MSDQQNARYSNLGQYYNGQHLSLIGRNYIAGSIVPTFGSMGYSNLTARNNQSNGSGYFSLNDAYQCQPVEYSLRGCN